jgi:hypothetical protein
MTKKNNLYINIKDDDSELATLVDFLRDGEISSRSIAAIKAFYLSQAIARDPISTPEDIRKAEHYCLSQLKQQMIYIMDKHYRDNDIKMDADEFSTVTINQSSLSQSPSFDGVISQGVGIASQNEDRQITAALPSSIAEPPVISIVEKPSEITEDEEDDDDDMTHEEYMAAMASVVVRPVMKA